MTLAPVLQPLLLISLWAPAALAQVESSEAGSSLQAPSESKILAAPAPPVPVSTAKTLSASSLSAIWIGALGLGLVSGLSGLGCSYLLFNRLGKLRYRISRLERSSANKAHSDLGLSQELTQLKAELNELRATSTARIVVSPPSLLGAIAAEPQVEQVLGSGSTDSLTSSQLGQRIETLIEAINQGDKPMIRNANPTELNITRASEDDIQMGRSLPTSLEVVLGGGSYLHFRLGTDDWLLPTERTLEGFSNHQPPKGIFKFFPRAVASAQVIVAARIMANGDKWLVSESGEIAFPG